MKKFILLAASIAAVLMCVSCNKGGNGKTVLPAPANAQYAKKMNLQNNTSGIRSIELTESGRFIVAEVKDGKTTYMRGKYTVLKSTQEYLLNGYGTVTIEDNNITVAPEKGDTITVTFTEAESFPENEFYTTIARAWKVDKTDLSVNLNGTVVGVVKNGCDIPAIASELNSKGLNINVAALEGFVVSEINYTMAKTIEIAFTGKQSFVGSFSLSETGTFGYTLEGNKGNDIISGSATGSIDNTKEEGKIYVSFSCEVTSGSSSYNGTVMFILSPAA